ncbi:hypothetical protein EDB85DRAFT_1896136 [Lactarius pseudohatsudake]|nr:hypothetical protein EDB85DRAFT_1896136 [Lactarius pseudohatsudake]
MIPEYANGCNADFASTTWSTSIVRRSQDRFKDYANPTRAPPTKPSAFHRSTGSCAQGMRSAASVVATPASAAAVPQSFLGPFRSIAILFCGLVDIKYSDPILSDMSDNNEQCALRPDGTLKDASEIPWLNDPDDAEPIPAHGLGAPSLNVDSNASTTAGSKGKEPAQLVGSRRAIKPTAKAQQASLTGFFSTRTVLIDGKEFAQTSSANSGNAGPAKQGGIYNT